MFPRSAFLPVFLLAASLAAPAFADETPPGATTIDAAGNMQFVVKGETSLRLAPQDNNTCDSSSAGALRFNKTTEIFEGCDGKGVWKKLGGGSAPTGQISWFAAACPDGYLEANGGIAPAASYPDLVAYIGTTYGAMGQLPDLRGQFVRGADGGRGLDAGRVFGSSQTDAGRNITGGFGSLRTARIYSTTGAFSYSVGDWHDGGAGGVPGYYYSFDASRVWGASHTAAEFRPTNIALMPCIKY